jgi:hypothetical protein
MLDTRRWGCRFGEKATEYAIGLRTPCFRHPDTKNNVVGAHADAEGDTMHDRIMATWSRFLVIA